MRTVHYRAQQYDQLGEFEAFMGAPAEPDAMGGLVHVVIGDYHGLSTPCYSHVFAFVVVQPFLTCRILACDRGKPCQKYHRGHVQKEIHAVLDERELSWPQFMSHYARHHPGAPSHERSRAWKLSTHFYANVTLLLDTDRPARYKLTQLESLHHYTISKCSSNPLLKQIVARYLAPVHFDQQHWPVCWLVSVMWLLALLPRLTEGSEELQGFVRRFMSAKSMERWVARIRDSQPLTRGVARTGRLNRAVVSMYDNTPGCMFDLCEDSSGGFPVVLLEAVMEAVGISLKRSRK